MIGRGLDPATLLPECTHIAIATASVLSRDSHFTRKGTRAMPTQSAVKKRYRVTWVMMATMMEPASAVT